MSEPEFPVRRLRRLRGTPALRGLVRETALDPARFVAPLFVHEEGPDRVPIASMPGQSRLSIDALVEEVRGLESLGVGGVILFGIPREKDALGSGAYAEDGIVQRAIRAIGKADAGIVVMADVCLCEYTDHGHCGVLEGGRVDNDRTLELLVRAAVSLAGAGVDVVAPSAMMDGQVRAIRTALDEAGRGDVAVMGYSAKYASAFYGPFRDAADSAPRTGPSDRRAYQMDPPNRREARREIAADVAEGADIVMVKPALAYLDVVRTARDSCDLPVAAYHVSGEYAMIQAAAERGWIDGRAVALESLTAIARAGADIVITYHASEAARWLREEER